MCYPPFFKTISPILPNPPFSWEKFEALSILEKNSKTQPPLIKERVFQLGYPWKDFYLHRTTVNERIKSVYNKSFSYKKFILENVWIY